MPKKPTTVADIMSLAYDPKVREKVKEFVTSKRYSGKKYTFEEAYKDARSKGQKTFLWDGKYYNTDYEGAHGKQYREDVASGKAAAWEKEYPNFTNPELRKEKQEELDTYGITNEQTKNKTIKDRTFRKIPARGYDVNDAISAIRGEHHSFSQYDSVEDLISALRKKYPKLKDIPLTGGYVDTVDGGKAIYLDSTRDLKKPDKVDDDMWQAFINDVEHYDRFNVLSGNPAEIHRPELDYLLGYPVKENILVPERGLGNTPEISKYRTGSDPYYYTTSLLESSVPFFPEKFLSRRKEGDPFDWESDEAQNKFVKDFDEFTERYYNEPEYAKKWEDIGVKMYRGGLDIDFPMLARSAATPSDLDTLASIKAFDYVEPLKLSPGNHLAGSGNEEYYIADRPKEFSWYKGKYQKYIDFFKDFFNRSKEDHNKYNDSNINTRDWIYSEPSLGTYTLGVPNDTSFVSVWDKFDIDPFGSGNDKPIIQVGKPFEYYTRFYPEWKTPDIDALYKGFNTFDMGGNKDKKQERKRIDSVTQKILQQAEQQEYAKSLMEGSPRELPLQSEDWKFALGMAGLSGLSKAIPAVGAELTAYGPLYKQAAKTLLTDIPAFEVVDRMPTLWGRGRLTQEVGSGVERGVRAVLPDGKVEDIVAPVLGTVAGFAAGVPVGGVSHLMASNAGNVLNATADAANRIMQDNVVRRATSSMLPVEDVYGYGNGAVSSLVEAPAEQAASTPLYQAYREAIGMPERFANPWVGFRSPSYQYAEPTFNYIEGMTPLQREGVNLGLNPGDPGYVDLDLNRIAAGVNMRRTARQNVEDYISRLGQARWPRDIRPADRSRIRHYDRFLNFNLPETSRNYRPMAVDPRTGVMDDAAAVAARENAVTRTGRRQEAVRRSYRERAEQAYEFTDSAPSANGLLSPVQELSDAEFARRATPRQLRLLSSTPSRAEQIRIVNNVMSDVFGSDWRTNPNAFTDSNPIVSQPSRNTSSRVWGNVFADRYGIMPSEFERLIGPTPTGRARSLEDYMQTARNLETEAGGLENLRTMLAEGRLPGQGGTAGAVRTPSASPATSATAQAVSQIPGNNEFIEDMFRQNWGMSVDEGAAFLRGLGLRADSMDDISRAFRSFEADMGSKQAVRDYIASRAGAAQQAAQSVNPNVAALRAGLRMPSVTSNGPIPPGFSMYSAQRTGSANLAEMRAAVPQLTDDELFNAYIAKMRNYIDVPYNHGETYARTYNSDIESDSLFRELAKEMQKRFGSTQGHIPGYEGETFDFGFVPGQEYDKLARWIRFSEDSPYVKNRYQYSLPGDATEFSWFNGSEKGHLDQTGENTGRAAMNFQKSVPPGSAVTERYTSVESEPLKASGALTNYGHGPGQSYVEILRSPDGKPIMGRRNEFGRSNRVNKEKVFEDFKEKLQAYEGSWDTVRAERAKKIAKGEDPNTILDPVLPKELKPFYDHIDNGSLDWLNEFDRYLSTGSSDYSDLFNSYISQRLSKSRANVLRKLSQPMDRISAIEGWTDIPAPYYTDTEEDIMSNLLDAIKYGTDYEYIPRPYSVEHHVIQHNLGGPLLLNPYAGGGGLSRSKDYKSSKKPYPSVKSGDFAGGGRSYPIPTKADAVDALRLAGLHHRPDVKAKVYAKYPSLKHADGGPLDNGIDYSGIETTNNRKYNPDYISYIDSALANAQLPDAKRASILANIIEESGGDPFALDSTGKFYGLLQWADDRYSPTGELDPYMEIDNQVANIINTLGNTTDGKSWTHGGTGSGYDSYRDAMADFDNEDLATAMKGFTLGYVRPSGKIDSYNNRLKVAQQILDKYNNVPEKKAATLIERMKAAFGNDTEAMQRLINAAKNSSGGFR